MHDGHFDVITKLPGFFDTSYFCLECEKGYSQEDYSHLSCKGKKCDACYQKNCRDYELFRHEENPQLPCKDCNRKFYGVTCQLNHLTMKANGQTVGPSERNVCRSHRKCTVCLQVFTTTAQEHAKRCGLQYCSNCQKEVNILQHRCYLQPIDEDDVEDDEVVFIYFDIEARQDTGNHVPNALKQIETTLNTRSRGTVVSLHSSGGSTPSPTTRLCKKLFSWLIILKVMMSISSWKNSTDSTPPTYPRLLTELKF